MVTEACVASGGELRDIVGGIDAMHLRRASARPIVQPLKPYPDYFPLPRQSHIASRIGQYRAVMFSVDIMMTAPRQSSEGYARRRKISRASSLQKKGA